MSEESSFFFNRELSWIEFNNRVLYEACRQDIPLMERLKFLAIVSSNFDEFFMVRVAGLKRQLRNNPEQRDVAGLTPKAQLEQIAIRAHQVVSLQYETLMQQVLPQLAEKGIEYVPAKKYTPRQQAFTKTKFIQEIFPLCTGIGPIGRRTSGIHFSHESTPHGCGTYPGRLATQPIRRHSNADRKK